MSSTTTPAQGSLVLACEFAPRHSGNFIAVEFAVAQAARERLGLRTLFVLPDRARNRYWVSQIGTAGFRCEFLPAPATRRPRALLEIARRADARILHSHFTWFDLDTLCAGRMTGAAVAWHVHNGLFESPRVKQRLSDLIKGRLLARGCDAVIAVSDHIGRELLERGFPASRVTVIPNALALNRLEHPAVARTEMRRRLGIGADDFLILSFAWPPVRKGADVLLEAVSRVRHTTGGTGPVKLVLVGEQTGLERFLRGRADWVSIVAPVEDVASLFGAADLFVSSSREEGVPYAVGEAMACGLPVVGSDIPGTGPYWPAPAFLRYPVEDRDALARELRELAESPHRRAELGQANRRWAFKHLGVERHVDEMVDCYRRLLARRVVRSRGEVRA